MGDKKPIIHTPKVYDCVDLDVWEYEPEDVRAAKCYVHDVLIGETQLMKQGKFFSAAQIALEGVVPYDKAKQIAAMANVMLTRIYAEDKANAGQKAKLAVEVKENV